MTNMTNMPARQTVACPAGEDYLVSFLRRLARAVMAFFTSARTKTACIALASLGALLLTVGIAGGVECGLLSVYCLLPLCALWPVAALLLHLNRK